MSFCQLLEWLALVLLFLALVPLLGSLGIFESLIGRLCSNLCRIWIAFALVLGALLGAFFFCCAADYASWWEDDCRRLVLGLMLLALLLFWQLLCWLGRCGFDSLPTLGRLSLRWWILLLAAALYIVIRQCCSEMDPAPQELDACDRLLLAALWLVALGGLLRYLACRYCDSGHSKGENCRSRLLLYGWLLFLTLLAAVVTVWRCCDRFADDPDLAMVGIWWDGERDVEPGQRFEGEEGAHLRWSFESTLGFPAGGFDLERRHSDGSSSWVTLNADPIHPVTEWGDETAVSGEMWRAQAVERIPSSVWDQFRDDASEQPFTELLTTLGQALADPVQTYYYIEAPEPAIAQPAAFYTDPLDVDAYLDGYYGSGSPEDRPPLVTWEQVPIDTLLTTAVFPDIARMIGLYYIDREREPDVEYDYRVIGYWADKERRYTVYELSGPNTAPLAAPVLDAPESPVSLGQLGGNAIFDDRAVALRWTPPSGTADALIGPIDVIDSIVFHAEHKVLADVSAMEFGPGDPPPTCPPSTTTDGFAAAQQPDVETGERIDADPVLVMAIEDESTPGSFAWPDRYFTHRGVPYGCHAYRVLGRDLFGRPSPHSTPGVVDVVDLTPPPPPVLTAGMLYQGRDLSLASATRETFFPEGSDHEFVLLVTWVWPEAAARRAPDLATFHAHLNTNGYATFVQSGGDAWRDPAIWDTRALATLDVADKATMPAAYLTQGLTEPANAYYAVAVVDSVTTELETSLQSALAIGAVVEVASLAALGLDAGDTAPVLYGHVGVSAVDARPYQNEGVVSAPVVVFGRDLVPPDAPDPPPDRLSGPSAADERGNAAVKMGWSANSLYTYELYRVDVAGLGAIRDDFADDELPACLTRPTRPGGIDDDEWAVMEEDFNIRVTGALAPGLFKPVSSFPIVPTGSAATFESKVDATVSSRVLYAARAVDAAGNVSTLSCPSDVILIEDAFAPRPPVVQEAVGADNAVSLTWGKNPETDVEFYSVYRTTSADDATSRRRMELLAILRADGSAAPASPSTVNATAGGSAPYETLTWVDDGATPGVESLYRIDVLDLSANRSDLSGVASARAFDAQPPAAPVWDATPLSATSTEVTLALAAAPEEGLRLAVQRRADGSALWQNVGAWTTYATSIGDDGVSGGVTYEYRTRAMDAAGNRGDWSSVESVAVPE